MGLGVKGNHGCLLSFMSLWTGVDALIQFLMQESLRSEIGQ